MQTAMKKRETKETEFELNKYKKALLWDFFTYIFSKKWDEIFKRK